MAPNLDWAQFMKVDPDSLPSREKLADKLLDTISKVEGNELTAEDPEKLIQLFRLTQSLMKMKAQEVELALEEVEKAGEEQAKTENQLKAKVLKLENELEMAQVSAGGRDTRFLREELRQVESQLQYKDREVSEMEKELNKEKKIVEQVGIRIKEIENENNKLRRENDQLRQDVIDYQKQIDSQRETLLNRRGDDSDYRIQLSKKNKELAQYLDEIQNLSEANEKLDGQNKQLQQKLEESVQEMDKMTDEYNKMKLIVQQSDSAMDQFKREKGQLLLQVQDLTSQLQAATEEEDPVMLAVNAKIEEWKKVLSAKDKEISEYQQKLQELRTKLIITEFDSDKSSVITLQQVLQERDDQIKALVGQIEQYTKEANNNVQIIEGLKMQLEKESSFPTLNLHTKIGFIQQKTQAAEQKASEAKRMADLAERDAREKDKALAEMLIQLRAYESGVYGLENAVAEIKECKNHIKIRDHQIEAATKEINKLEMKINDLLDENENFRQRLGLAANEVIDLSEFRKIKYLKQQQFQAENQVLLKEIERLEEERLVLKRQIRRMAQDKGMQAGVGGISAEDLGLVDPFNEKINSSKETELSSSVNFELNRQNRQIRGELLNKEGAYQNAEFELAKLNRQIMQNEYISRELEVKEKELEKTRTESAQLKAKLKELVEENQQFESGMKDILHAIKSTQVEAISKGGEEILKIESLEKLVTAIERKNTTGKFNSDIHLKAQLDQMTGRNEELRQELKEARKEAGIAGNQLAKATERITNLESELTLLRQSGGCSVVFQPLALPEGMVPSSIDVINTLNEYLVQLLQEISNKEKEGKKLQEAAEDHKRKFAVIRHQQGLLYKEYQSERESWQKNIQKIEEEKKKLEHLKEQDQVKIEEYNQLLETLQVDPDEMKKKLAGLTSKLTVLRVNESSLTRRYTTLVEMEQHLRKENNKLKDEIIAMEAAVSERIGYLQRFKDMASFKIAALQKALDESVPISDLERANKQHNELTAKYRDLLQKDNLLVQKTTDLEHLEGENTVLREQIRALNKELEITKEKQHTLEQALEEIEKRGPTAMDKETKAITNSEIVSISKKITMLEMKELNERQRAEHAQTMYEHVRDTLKQVEERNSELESKFSEVTKINLEAQRVEQNLRDELANSVSQAVSNADRSRITELEKSESELKVEVSKLRDVADVAKMQVTALEARQQSREKEVEALRKQVLDYQAQSDERALIATLHQHIIALQVSETTAVSKLQAFASKLQKMEACNLRLMQKLDEKDQTLFHTRLEGKNKAKHLRQTIQSLRRQFSGALPLAQQEKFSKTMMQLQDDKLKIMQDVKRSQEERRVAEDKALELELKLKGLEELIGSLKDAKGAQKVIEWHKKIEELRLQDLKTNRCINKQKEEITYLNNVITDLEHTINNLEEETVQQNKLHEERQIAWDRRELELQHQLDMYEHQHNEILSAAQKFEEATGSIPDPNKPLPEQLNVALQKIREHVFIILETQATCRTLEEKLKEKEASLWKAEQNVLSRDQVINELRLRLPATAEREKLMVDLSTKTDDDTESRKALKVAHQTIANLQARLDQKEEVLQKYQQLLTRAHQDREEIAKKHEKDLKALHLKLDSYADASLNKFKQSAVELMKKPSLPVPTSKHLARLAELEQTVAEQDSSLSALVDKLKRATMELEKQKDINQLKVKEHNAEKANLEEMHATEVKKLCNELDDLKCTQLQMEKEVQYLQSELEAQKQANTRAPTTTMKNLVDRLKGQLALKEKQQKALSKALLDLRAEMTSHAEQQIINQAAQKEGHLNVQQIVDKQTKELRTRIEDLTEQLATAKDSVKACKSKEVATAAEIENLNGELQKKQRVQNKLQTEKDELMKENEELKKKIKRLCDSLQTKTETDNKQSVIDELQKKVRRLECELNQKVTPEQMERKVLKEERTSKEEIVRWEEGKKWQARLEGLKHKLKEKEKELETVTKQITTLKELYAKADQEKAILQKKLKARGITADQVIGVRSMECDREIEDLKRKNTEFQDQIVRMRQQQALPRDSVVEDLTLKNQYLHEKVQALEKQLSKNVLSRPSTPGVGADASAQKEQELQRENLRLAAENVELRFQLEQADKDLPRLKDQIVNLQEMYQLLKKERAELERKLGNMRGSGRSGKTVPELEKTIGLMKKVVERVQRENEELKKAPGVISSEKQTCLEMENDKLKLELEKLKLQVGGQLSLRYESKTKGVEKILAENERLRKELKKIEVLKHFPEEAKTEPGLTRELQLLRLTNDRLEKEKAELLHHLKMCRKQTGEMAEGSTGTSRNVCEDGLGSNEDKLTGELLELQTQLKASDLEKQQLQEEIQQLKKELKNFDPSFFEELEDLKFNYNQEVKRNILLEEQLQKLAKQFGVQVTIPENISTD